MQVSRETYIEAGERERMISARRMFPRESS
jgi:hypothetical protein